MRIRPTTNKRNREQALRDHQIEKAERKKKRRENPDEDPELPHGDVAPPVDTVVPLIAVRPALGAVAAIIAPVPEVVAPVPEVVATLPEIHVTAAVPEAPVKVTPQVHVAVVAPEVLAVAATPEAPAVTPETAAVSEALAVAPEVIAVIAETVIAVPEVPAVASENVAALPEIVAPEVLAAESEGLAGVPVAEIPEASATASEAPASESDVKEALPAGAKRPVGRARSASARDSEAQRNVRPTTDAPLSVKPESAAARQSQTLLIAGVEAVSGAWVEELRHSLRRERRPISGGWPGTLSEARHRVAVCLLPWLQQRGGVVHYNQSPPTEVARQLNSAARRAWLMQSEADHEPWEAHAEGAADPSP